MISLSDSIQERDLSAYHPGEVSWKEGEYTVTRTTQWSGPGCHDGCAVLFYTKDNKLVKVEGDPTAPYNKGRLCMRCLGLPEMVNHPQRLLHPVRRVGQRGENKWEEISWDEALEEITTRAKGYMEEYGPTSIAVWVGTGRNAFWQANALGVFSFGSTGTIASLNGDSCYVPRRAAMMALIGNNSVADCAQMYEKSFDDPRWETPEYMLVWGCNPLKSNSDGFYGHWVTDLMKQGTKLIVVDPDVTFLGARAECVLQIRPGTDGALALAMLNTVISEDLYDHDFVERWTYGFDELKESVADKTPEWAAEVCWLDADDIRRAARLFAGARAASVQWGVALDMTPYGVNCNHAIVSLWAICGFVDVPGGMILVPDGYTGSDFAMACAKAAPEHCMPTPDNTNYLGWNEFPFRASTIGSMSDMMLQSMETGDPVAVKMAYMGESNSFVNAGCDARRWYEAIGKCEFVVVQDLWLTPTATALADIVLPVAMSCERNGVRDWWAPYRAMKKVIDNPNVKSDEEMILEIGRRMRPESFPWKDDAEFLTWLMPQRSTSTFKGDFHDLCEQIYWYEDFEYKKYEKGLLRPDGKPGFQTRTGRIELWSTLFASYAENPLPYYREPNESPESSPELFEEFPLVLTTGHRSYEFFHSEHRNSKYMREFHPWPLVQMHPEDAKRYGIADGDWVWIQNNRGKCKQVALVTESIREGVVQAEHGWWYPERDGSVRGGYYGAFESNINNLTSACDVGPLGYGAPYKCLLCKVYKVTSENDDWHLTPQEIERSNDARCHIDIVKR